MKDLHCNMLTSYWVNNILNRDNKKWNSIVTKCAISSSHMYVKNHIHFFSLPTIFTQGLAKYVEWSANMMEDATKRQLKSAELQAKKDRIRIWINYVPPQTNSKAIHDQNFTGKVCCFKLILFWFIINFQTYISPKSQSISFSNFLHTSILYTFFVI